MKIYPLRERLTLPINGKDEVWDYLTLYDASNNIVLRSEHSHSEGEIRLLWEGLMFVSPGNSKEIFVTFDSIMKKFY